MGTETRFNICEIVKMMLNISVSKYERIERIVSELETQGFECIERKNKKLIMFEPFDKREIHIYFKKINNAKYFTGFKITEIQSLYSIIKRGDVIEM